MRNQKKRIVKILVVLSAAILIILSSSAARLIRINLADTSTPLLKTVHSFLGFLEDIAPFAVLREENRILRDRIDLLTRMAEEGQAINDENARLRNLLDFRKMIPYASMPAQVIGRDPSNWSNSLIIDKGAANGVKQNMAVMSTRGIVGRIVEIGKYSSKVLLITDPNLKVGVLIRRNRQGGVMVGRPGDRCKIIYIALDSDAKPGDKVITAGFGGVFPKGILVGEIEKVGKEEGRLYKYAIVKPSQDLSKLEEVLCIIR
ncbi:MAG: rod shape-determining protein MreC [Omnitrophica bacterium RIFCSPLOWO2_02_FULL_45_16]|nr:MAG: rod shape-determining protein MreC [Omnitrophica bacterium RIFCSPHIGHO2_02_FULL_46_20]OGW94298.1 MAG: rod shape-determining protein MreC [Omnitrophica bacterium RIFCSPLOWO2_12_FULL_45_13]OGW94510.1 MAG: rod shape-determining protein MreC [Omnitrophica bacterium RIFCSPLOWO2_01_FULL_45_24]OGW99988.1 MAG: rod shape-determining protein MreC [Omnitrophica bacterium RIFCSPLOWO2_02_FULL_45_16]